MRHFKAGRILLGLLGAIAGAACAPTSSSSVGDALSVSAIPDGGATPDGGAASGGRSDAGADAGADAGTSARGVTVTPDFFCLNINKPSPWPLVPFGVWRSLNSLVNWADINRSAGQYDWTRFDAYMSQATDAGQKVTYTVYTTPSWASTCGVGSGCEDAGVQDCSGLTRYDGPGWCFPPNDLAVDGSGTDQHLKDFLGAMLDHLDAQGWHVDTWEVWNEPNIGTEWRGSTAQLIRIADDVMSTVRQRDPAATFTTPPFTSWPNQPPAHFIGAYLDAGGPPADAIAFHGYLYPGQPPEDELPLVQGIQAVMQSHGLSAEPLLDTEDSPGMISGPGERIAWTARSELVQMAAGVSQFCWFSWNLNDPGYDLYDFDGGLSALGVAYAQVHDWTVGRTFTAPCGPLTADAGVWGCPLAAADGYAATVAWDTSSTCDAGQCPTTNFPAPSQFTQYRDLAGKTFPIAAGTVPLGAQPILLEQ